MRCRRGRRTHSAVNYPLCKPRPVSITSVVIINENTVCHLLVTLEVVADHRLKGGGCVLETELGIVDASVELQLQALEKALKSRIGTSD